MSAPRPAPAPTAPPAPADPSGARDAPAAHRPTGVAVLVADAAGVVLQVGGAAESLLGLPAVELVGRRVTDLLVADDGAALAAAVVAVLGGEADARVTASVRDEMGLPRPLEASLCLIDGDPDLLVVTLAPDPSQPHLHVGVDPARTLITITDAPARVVHVSRGATALLGWTPSEVAVRGAPGIIHPDDLAHFTSVGTELRAEPGAVRTTRVRALTADGGTRWVRAMGMNLLQDPGVGGLVTCITDATDEVRDELRAAAADLEVVGALGEATLRATPDGLVSFASEGGARALGQRPEAVLATRLGGRLDPEGDGELSRALAAVAAEPRLRRTVDVRLPTDHRGERRLRIDVESPGEGVEGPDLMVHLSDVTERVQATEAVRASERRFRTLVQSATDILAVVDADLRVRWVSPVVTTVLGYPPEALVDLPATSFLHPDDAERVATEAARLADEPRPDPLAHIRARARHADGGWRHMSLSGTDLTADPDVGGLLITARDVTVEVEAERGRERLAQVLQASTDLVAIAHRGTDLIDLNRAGCRVLGLGDGEEAPAISLEALAARTPPWVQRRFLAEVVPTLESSGIWEGELAVHDRDGDVVPVSVVVIALRDRDGAIETLACWARDISDRKAFEDQLEHQATHDPLTGLPNRTLLLDRLRVAVGRAQRQSTLTAVLFLDLDNFKLINDSLGHSAGDVLLVEVARRIEGAVRPGDTVARFGGDEFAVLCEDLSDRAEAVAIATRIEEAVGHALEIEGTEVMVTVSIGVASSDGDHDAESLVRDSDAAMYQAKARGRSRTEVFDRDMHVQAVDRLELETALRRAVDRHEMRVAYQPQYDLRTGRLDGVEALVRWEHPERGILLPGEFLHIAEETGLIVAIGNWITSAACRATARLHDLAPEASDIVVSVNLSARQLASPRLIDDVAAIVAAAELPPGALMLELTETVLMDVDASGEALTRLHELGVGIAVDDFGTGWSSLRYLRDFPVDALKVDRTFVAGLGRDPEDEAIVAAVIDLAHALGLKAVAEGVEDETRLARLRALGCDSAQGWLLGRPMAEADLIDLVLAQGPAPEA